MVGFEKALGAVKVIKDQIQYWVSELAQLSPWLLVFPAILFCNINDDNRHQLFCFAKSAVCPSVVMATL